MTVAVKAPPEFRAFPKIPRLFDQPHDGSPAMVVTEKIDGTNGCIVVTDWGDVHVQSRNRFLTSEQDNFGFANWAQGEAEYLADTLGPGRHYGEWWGEGIQRGYGVKGKRFSLFNTSRWKPDMFDHDALGVVPVLSEMSTFFPAEVFYVVDVLIHEGSAAAPGFMRPEGVVVYHARSGQLFKHLIDKDGK